MQRFTLELITDITRLVELKTDWEKVFRKDPNAQIYISWDWFSTWAKNAKSEWVVLAIKDGEKGSFIAFLPLSYQNHKKFGITLTREIEFGGMPNSVYSGFLCLSDGEPEAMKLFVHYIQVNLKWDILRFRWCKDPRLEIFVKEFPKAEYHVDYNESLPSLCITLPNDYQTYFNEFIGKASRRTIRRKLKLLNEDEKYKISFSTKSTIKRDVDATCELWFNRWQKQDEANWHKIALHHFFKQGLLRLIVIWDGETPVSADACLIDPENKIYNAYITSYNPAYARLSPGFVLCAMSIEEAIGENYKYYDFTVGMDSYKLAFGPDKTRTKSVMIKRKNLKNRAKLMARKIRRCVG